MSDCKCNFNDCKRCKSPIPLKQLLFLEKIGSGNFPIPRSEYMKLIQFAKGFAENEEELRKIIAQRATEEQQKQFSEELEGDDEPKRKAGKKEAAGRKGGKSKEEK